MTVVYKLVNKFTDDTSMSSWVRIALNGILENVLIISEDYYIERYLSEDYLFYIHIKNGGLTKVCVYRKENEQ